MPEQNLRLFVSSPTDVADERRRVEIVVERLNAEFKGRVHVETVRWETGYYSAHDTFQKQIPEASVCDVVVAIFRARLGTELPKDFPKLPNGEPYPSGTAYEILSAIEARKADRNLPDIYVFRYPRPPSIELDDPHEAQIKTQWERLKAFFDTWFKGTSGQFLAAFQDFTSTDDFAEKLEDCLRQWLAKRGYTAEGPVWDRLLDGSPFPGLGVFDGTRERVFFGRGLATVQAGARLREAGGHGMPFLLVIGASGSGKSSFLRAGLVPYLARPGTIPEVDLWRNALVVVGPDPLSSLAEALFVETALGTELRQGDFRTTQALAALFAGNPDTSVAPVRTALERAAASRAQQANFTAPRPARLMIAIDQTERLFLEATPDATRAFAAVVAALIRHQLAYVIVALRSDAYPRFQLCDELRDLREAGATFDLVPPAAGELEEIVTCPVAACHPPLAFELRNGRSLASVLVEDARGGDILPLLQMTLSRLFDAEACRGDGFLRFADYPGINAAVTKTAEEVLATLDEDARAEVPALITALVRDVALDPLTGTPVPVISVLDRASFEQDRPARAALTDAFVARRLLTAEGTERAIRLRPVHEALLRIWPEAVKIVAENASLIRVRHTLEPIVRSWQEADQAERARHLDISPALLGGAQELLDRFGADLPVPMRDFIAQSSAADAARRDRERNRQRTVLAAAGAALIIVTLLAVAATWQWRSAELAKQEAQVLHDRAELAVTKFIASLVSVTQDNDRGIKDLDEAIKLAPTDAANFMFRGMAYQQKNDFDHAIADYTEAIALNPKLAYAYAFRGVVYNAKKDYDRSIADFSRMFQLNTTFSLAYSGRGFAYYSKHDYDRAIEDYEQAIKLDPTGSEYYDGRGNAYRGKGDYDRAIEDYTQAIKLNPNYAAAYSDRAFIYYNKEQYDLAIADYDTAIKLDPTNSEYHDNRGDAYRGKGDYDRAIVDYTLSIKLDPKYAVAYNDRGLAYYSKRNYDRAIADYDQAVKLDPNVAVYYDNRGDAHLGKGDLFLAIGDYGQAIKLDPTNALSFTKRGIVYHMQGNFDRAIEDYDQAIKLDPDNAVTFASRGLTHYNKGELDLAILDYNQAIKLDSNVFAYYDQRGDAYLGKGDLSRAIEDYGQVIKRDPTNALIFAKRGIAYLMQGDFDRAITDYDEAIRLDPDNAVMFSGRGLAYYNKGNFDRAILDFDRAINLDPNVAAYYDHRGDAYRNKGDDDHAIADYDQEIKLDPTNALAFSKRGIIYHTQGDYERAIADYDQAIHIAPTNAAVLNQRCFTRAIVGRLESALSDCNEALRLQPGDAATLDSRGLTYLKLGQFVNAIADYDAALRLNPQLVDSLYGRGLAKLKKGDTKGGEADIAAAKAMFSDIAEHFVRYRVL